MIIKLLSSKGDHEKLEKHYVEHLISWHSELKMGRTHRMKNKQLSALNPAIIKWFFSEFERLQHEYKVKSQNIYNMDKTDF